MVKIIQIGGSQTATNGGKISNIGNLEQEDVEQEGEVYNNGEKVGNNLLFNLKKMEITKEETQIFINLLRGANVPVKEAQAILDLVKKLEESIAEPVEVGERGEVVNE